MINICSASESCLGFAGKGRYSKLSNNILNDKNFSELCKTVSLKFNLCVAVELSVARMMLCKTNAGN